MLSIFWKPPYYFQRDTVCSAREFSRKFDIARNIPSFFTRILLDVRGHLIMYVSYSCRSQTTQASLWAVLASMLVLLAPWYTFIFEFFILYLIIIYCKYCKWFTLCKQCELKQTYIQNNKNKTSIQWTPGSQIYLRNKIIFGHKWFLNKKIKTRQSIQWTPGYTF